MWNRLLGRVGFRPQPEPVPNETADALIAKTPELRDLLEGLGYNPQREEAAGRLMAELRSSIRAEVADFGSLRTAVAAAQQRRRAMPEHPNFALLDALAAAGDEASALAILNADPIHGQVPFIEQIPVQKNGELIWRSPVDRSLIRRTPRDPNRFAAAVAELEELFSAPHRARLEAPRLAVLDAIARLRRELDRDKSHLPTPLLFLETKLDEYRSNSLRPGAADAIEAALATTTTLVELRNTVTALQGGAGSAPDNKDMAWQVSGLAANYLATRRIQIPWLTNAILGLVLHPRLTGATGKIVATPDAITMDLIRLEIQGGYYDAEETVQRLRRMEVLGFHVISLAYPLLRLNLTT